MIVSSFFLSPPTSVGALWKVVWPPTALLYPDVEQWLGCRVLPPVASATQCIPCLAVLPVASATIRRSLALLNERRLDSGCRMTLSGSPLGELVAFRVVASRWLDCEQCGPPRLQLFVLCRSWGRLAKAGSSSLARYPQPPPQEHRAAGCSPQLCAVVSLPGICMLDCPSLCCLHFNNVLPSFVSTKKRSL